MRNIAVVGAGVSGLTVAVLLAERGYRTTIFAAETGAHTTSAAAAAIWFPYDAEPVEAVTAWSLATYSRLVELAQKAGTGVSLIELRCCSRGGEIAVPPWALSLGARRLVASEIPRAFLSGFAMKVPLTDTTIYLPYLADRFANAGGTVRDNVHLDNLETIDSEHEIIINCAGIGARSLVPDFELEPHRGQVVIVEKLQLPYALVCDDPPLMYAIPRAQDCVFGGTNDVSEDRAPQPGQTSAIINECSRVLDIESPLVFATRVGLRPFRGAGVRLERALLRDGRTVVHNYGHGGSGFTLSWGCAERVLALVD